MFRDHLTAFCLQPITYSERTYTYMYIEISEHSGLSGSTTPSMFLVASYIVSIYIGLQIL